MATRKDPWQVFTEGRQAARQGNVMYDGDKFPISFSRDVQERIEQLAEIWKVPRTEMVRYLVGVALDRTSFEHKSIQQKQAEEEANEDAG